MKHFEAELPQGYVAAKIVDAKNTKTAVVFNVVALFIMAAVFGAMWLIMFGTQGIDIEQLYEGESPWQSLLYLFLFLLMYFAYIVLHELTHGIAYKALTKQKLTFGMTLSVAYCGVPNIFVYRTCALVALLAPFVVFTPVFLLPALLVENLRLKLIFAAMFVMHFGGCVGDLYDTCLYAFVFRDKTTLMRDTGPKQTFYVLENSALGQKLVAKGVLEEMEQPFPADAQEDKNGQN